MTRFLALFGILLGLFLTVSIGIAWYLNSVWLPSYGKAQIETALAKATGKHVAIGALRYVPLRGFVAQSLAITNSPEPLLTASEVELRLALGPLLLSRTAAFKTSALLDLGGAVRVRADGTYHLDRQTLELEATLDRLPLTALARFVTLPDGLTIEDGTAAIEMTLQTDEEKRLQASGEVTVTSGRVSWRGIEATLDGTAKPMVTYRPAEGGTNAGTLDYTVEVALAHLQASGVPTIGTLSQITGTLTLTPQTLTIRQLRGQAGELPWTIAGNVALKPEPTADLTLEADLTLPRDLALVPPPHRDRLSPLQPTGRGHLTARLLGPTAQPERLLRQARLTLEEASAQLASASVSGLRGTLEYADQRLTIPTLIGRIGKAPFTLSGTVTLAPEITMQLRLESDLDLARDAALLPEAYRSRVAPWQPAGRAHLAATLDGPPTASYQLLRAADLTLEQGAARISSAGSGGAAIALSRISGTLHYADDRLTLRVTGAADEQPLALNASVEGRSMLQVTLSLESGPLTVNAEAEVDLENQHLQVAALQGVWGRSRYAVHGELSDWRNPQVNIYDSEIELDWEDLATRLPALAQATAAWPIRGTTRHTVLLRGPLKQWTDCEALVKSNAQRLTVKELTFEALFADARLQRGQLQLSTIRGAIAGGSIDGTLQIDLRSPARPFQTELRVAEVDLATLRRQLGVRSEKSEMSGRLTGRLGLMGDATRQESYRGSGEFSITGGKLFEKSLLGPIADLLQQPVLSRITFHEAAGTFTVAQRRLTTNDLRLISRDTDTGALQAQIEIAGSVGFDQTLDLDATMALTEQLTQADSTIGRIAGLITGTPLLNRVHIGGTLSKPKVSLLGGLPTGEIQDFLHGIFGGK